MPSGLQALLGLFLLFAAAKIGEELFERLRQPALIGQILGGFLIGPSVLHWLKPSPNLDFMAEIGVMFLLFQTGLDTQPEEILEHGLMSFLVAVLGVLTPLALGWWFALAVGENPVTARFVGTLLTATSIGITARVLADFHASRTAFGRVILGAAVLDDILGLLALSTLTSFAGARPSLINMLLTIVFVSVFFVLVLVLRRTAWPRMNRRMSGWRARSPVWSFSLVLLLGFSVMSAYIGLAAVIGAFLAGIFLSESNEIGPLRQQAHAVGSFAVPFFLANIGLKLNTADLFSGRAMFLIAMITLIAIVSKLAACGLAALKLGRKDALRVGLGMIPRGEVGIVVADQSLRIPAIPNQYYSIGIAMAVLTSIIGPLLLRLVMRPPAAAASPVSAAAKPLSSACEPPGG